MAASHPSPLVSVPLVSVIIPIYNGAADIPDLGECLLRQTYPGEAVEYLLVDNNSQDQTAQLLAELAQRAAQQGLCIRPLSEPNIQSSYAARNRGIQSAQGEILVFTDGDCRPQDDWVAKMVAPFATAPELGLVVGEVEALPGHTWLEHYAEHRQILTQRNTLAHPYCPYGQTANLAIRRQALIKTGLFRPYMTTGGDADLCWRVQLEGHWQLHFVADALVRHRHRATLKELASQWRRYGCSNRYLHELHGVRLQSAMEAKSLCRALLRWLGWELPKGIGRWLRGQGSVLVVAIPLDIFCGRSRIEGQRQAQLPPAAREIEWLEVRET